MGEPRGGFYPDDEPDVPPSRSTGVQQGRVEAAARALHHMLEDGGGVTTIPYPESHDKAWWEMCARAVLSAAAEAVSPEPREQDARGVIRGSGTPRSPLRNPRAHEPMLDERERLIGEARAALPELDRQYEEGIKRLRDLSGSTSSPREGEQDDDLDDPGVFNPFDDPSDVDDEPDRSVASVLRLTASRLRDPEHRWLEDPAVTLERLAEKLEKGRDDG